MCSVSVREKVNVIKSMHLCVYVYLCLCVGAFQVTVTVYILVTDTYTVSDLSGSTQEKAL